MYVELSYLIEDFYELPELFFYSSKVNCFKCWQCPGINPDPCLALDWERCIVKSIFSFRYLIQIVLFQPASGVLYI